MPIVKKLGLSCIDTKPYKPRSYLTLEGKTTMINLQLELTESEAISIARFLKHTGYKDYLDKSVNKDQAYKTMWSMDKIRIALLKHNIRVK